ncbi:MAG: tryptophan-rich sensory protein [Bacteroidota bacterium]
MTKTLQIANGIALVSTVFINYLSNTGLMNNTTIGEVSGGLRSLFTPAGYAFAIWGLIYILLFGFALYQGRSLFVKGKKDSFVLDVGWWFVISCIANCAWIFAWIYGYTGLSVICMFIILFSLLRIIWKNNMELWDAPLGIIFFLWWPFVIYSGWIAVASIANVSAYLVKIGWDGLGISEVSWTLFMIGIATAINLLITWRRNMREFALVGAWALVAIAVANEGEPVIRKIALASALLLMVSSGIHALKNYKTNPLIKLFQSHKK